METRAKTEIVQYANKNAKKTFGGSPQTLRTL